MKESDLLEAIRAAPDDDAPRLVYGDFLLSKGDPRGELIQVQCRLADPAIAPSEHRRLRAVENKLLDAHGAKWNAPVLEAIERDAFSTVEIELRRGFVDSVRAPAKVLERIDALFAAAPLLTSLHLDPSASYDQPAKLREEDLDSSHLAGLRKLHISLPGIGDVGAERIANCRHLSNLNELVLTISWFLEGGEPSASSLGERGARALASSPHLANVRRLVISENRLGTDGVVALLESPQWKLEELEIGNNMLDDDAISAIADSASLDGLSSLSLAGSVMSPAVAKKLAASPHLRNVTALDLEDCDLGPKGIAGLLDGMGLEAMTSLSIESVGLGDAGAQIVAHSAKLRQLRILNIRKNQIGKKGLATLAMSENFSGLEKITIHDRESKEAREAFLTSPSLAKAAIYFRGKLLSKAAKLEKVEEKAARPVKRSKATAKAKGKKA